ncbi:MAG: recombination mediator RecR [Bacteroides sp.]|jgi:recombination protein recR
MEEQGYGSVLLAEAVRTLCKLPGVGKRTALRYILSLYNLPNVEQQEFLGSLHTFISGVQRCPICNNFSDNGEPCSICSDPHRDAVSLCIVADVRDLLAIEQAEIFRGSYFVLGHLIQPLKGLGPDNLPLLQLEERIQQGIEEVILAFPNNMESDLTVFYLQRRLVHYPVAVTTLARGIPFGSSVEQTDETTIALAFEKRVRL